MTAFIVYRNGRKIDTVYFDGLTCEEVRRHVVREGKHGPNVSVQRDASKAHKDRNRRH